MIELSEEQKKAVAEAQATFKNLKDNAEKLTQEQLNLLFGEARSTVSYTHLRAHET